MKRFNKILSEISGYTIKELTDRNTEPLIQPFDCLLAMEQVKNNDCIADVMPRYFIDERAGCAAVRDREHPKYDKTYPGLHQDTPDVVVYAHGFQNHEKKCWEMNKTDIDYLKLECDKLNNSNGA